ncbi:beta-phosphoglucomutase [Clostridium folliculivorans]|uniref:Beta-phosphoglucomutase n=1 Tax=Clostridium folliculivorans TaxID=2886038 RepID=A0A9W6D8E9_9CLOT|nr:beta-phosphoglucomutase [Clostridium folliculivorans]GKU23414.1 beta-phosphoglucomutase [Clostridium folliculivorans]GKU29531.1 beta-phosphoglucomutase [Clostridium folliculivorans]
MHVKGCIFDLDGVIVDTAKYHYLAWKRLANELGFDFTEKDNERLKGVSRMASLEILLSIGNVTLSEDQKLALAAKKNEWYVEYISRMNKNEILPGVETFLQTIRCEGIKVSLGSASKNSMMILDNLELTKYFDAIIDGNKVSEAKPDPEVFLLAAKELDLDPKDCVVFEDAEAGIEAAIRAGMRSIGIGSVETLGKATKVVPNLKDADLTILEF